MRHECDFPPALRGGKPFDSPFHGRTASKTNRSINHYEQTAKILLSVLGIPSSLRCAANADTQSSAGKLALAGIRSLKGQQLFIQRVLQGDSELFCVGRLPTHFYFTRQSQVVEAFIQTGVVIVHHDVHRTHERATSFPHPEFPSCAISPGSVYTSCKHGNAASAVTWMLLSLHYSLTDRTPWTPH